jgi:hypothetical protein
MTPNGTIIGTATTGGDGVISYSPRELVSKMGTASYIIARSSGGQDTDADDDGVRDAVPTPVSGSFQMIIPRSTLERATPTGQSYQMVMNPVAWAISETILARTNAIVSQEALDHIAREVGISDTDNNGVINYADITSIQMKNITGVSSIVPAVSGYIRAIHTNDPTKKTTALRNIAKTENHLLASIVANPTNTDHTPALHLQSISGGTILYTLDGSSPIAGASGTQSSVGTLTIPMRDATLYYREQFVLNGTTVLGKVKRFDLKADWTTLAQESVPYNQTAQTTSNTESASYKSTNYTITTVSNAVNPAYTYPKTLGCQIGTVAGCHLGPYMVWSPEHESRVRSMIATGVANYVEDNTVVTPPTDFVETIRSNISYGGASYAIIDTWTRWANGTRSFPVTVTATITRRNGQTHTLTKTAQSQSDVSSMNTMIEQEAKTYIDTDTAPAPGIKAKNTLEIIQNWTNHKSSKYMIQVKWNTAGSLTTNYPTTVQGIYQSPKTGYNVEINTTVNSDSERTSTINGLPVILQAHIDSEIIIVPTPTCTFNQIKRENSTYYRWAHYQSKTICNMSGTADYPMRVSAEYTLPGSSTVYETPNPETVYNDTQRTTQTNYHLSIARARIDAVVDDVYPPGYTRTTPRAYYGWGSHYYQVDYSKYVGKDFPADLWGYITYKNGYSEWPSTVGSGLLDEWQITASMNSWDAYARSQIDNINPTYAANYIGSDGPHLHGTRWGDYTIKVQYNRTGQNKNYPVMIWIEYRMRSGGPPLDTRNIVGIWTKYAYSSTEKDQIKDTLVETVKGKMTASASISPTQFAQEVGSRIGNMLISPAHAATPSSIVVKNNYVSLPNHSYIDPTTSAGKFLAYNGNILDHYVKRGSNSASMAWVNAAEIGNRATEKMALETYLAVKGEFTKRSLKICTGQWLTIWSCVDQSYIQLPPANSSSAGIRFKIADSLFWRNWVNQMNTFIDELLKYNTNFLIMYAIIFEEQSHLMPPYYEDAIMWYISDNDTVGMSQIRVRPSQADKDNFWYTDSTRQDLLDPTSHLRIMNDRINKIRSVLKRDGKTETAENIWRAWNGGYNCINWSTLCTDGAVAYGKRIRDYSGDLALYYQAFNTK